MKRSALAAIMLMAWQTGAFANQETVPIDVATFATITNITQSWGTCPKEIPGPIRDVIRKILEISAAGACDALTSGVASAACPIVGAAAGRSIK
jgi:hypothetical protein